MRKTLIAVAVAALSLPAAAVFHERTWLGNVSYFDDTSGITWMDGLRDEEPYESWNRWLYGGGWQNAPSLEQLQSLNRSRQESDPFVHLLFVGPPGVGGLRNDMWTSTTVPCLWIGTPASPALCKQVPVGEPFDYMVPLVYHFGAGDGYWHPYQDDWPLKLSLRYAVGNVGTPITSAVPEPGTWALFAAGLAVIGASARKRRFGGAQVAIGQGSA
jgi:hypothetical protein